MGFRFRCNMPTCGQPPRGFEFESDTGHCPKCGRSNPPGVWPLVDVHFVVLDPKGPIRSGEFGATRIACQPDRPHMAANIFDEFHASDHPEAVTCPRCRGTKEWLQAARTIKALRQELDGVAKKTMVEVPCPKC